MFSRLMPREGKFFDLFNAHAEQITTGLRELAHVMSNFNEREQHARAVSAAEKSADKITHDCVQLLHRTFITPLDRDQIHALINMMDDILDLAEDIVECIDLYDIKSVTPEARQLADICVSCADRVKAAVAMLSNLDNGDAILRTCAQIDQLESDADRVMRSAISKLFRSPTDARDIIKLKAIYEQLEAITDKCEDVANLIEGILLENA
ncbi:MAG TPA: DUF47 family protein [Burkholderiaceae bacterium]|nr:DUF47 family protein [Burkholderiaceae bacterium]